MMDFEAQLKLQAYLDRELPAGEAHQIEQRLAADAEARALLAELTATKSALDLAEPPRTLPESREFFWSKIEREIRRPKPHAAPQAASVWAGWRRWLISAGATAALALAALLVYRPEPNAPGAVLADSSGLTYHDFAAQTTLVWLSYPAENEFADEDLGDTLD